MMMMKKSCNQWSPILAMVAINFAFAVVNILLKEVLVGDGMNHLVFISYRQSISTIFLAPLAYFAERNRRPKLTLRILCHLFVSAIVGASLTQYFFLLGIQYTSATFSCAFINMVPVITFMMAVPFKLENLNMEKGRGGRAKMLGTLVCLGGAMILTLYKGVSLFNTKENPTTSSSVLHRPRPGGSGAIVLYSVKIRKERWAIGSMSLIAGSLLWSSWFLVQSNIAKSYPCQYSSTAIMSFFAAVQSSVLGFSLERRRSVWALKGKMEILTVLYSGMVGSGLCYVGMSWCVKRRGPIFTSAFSPLIQIVAALFDISILHEQLHLGSLLGSITVIAGLYILLWGKNKEMQDCSATKVAQETVKDQEPVSLQVIAVDCSYRRP